MVTRTYWIWYSCKVNLIKLLSTSIIKELSVSHKYDVFIKVSDSNGLNNFYSLFSLRYFRDKIIVYKK